MPAPILSQRELDFMLYELFDGESLAARDRYSDHSRETFDAAINTAPTVAERYFLPVRQLPASVASATGAGDVNEHPVEMMYRDNRLNLIHEGMTGIQSLDLGDTCYTMSRDWF